MKKKTFWVICLAVLSIAIGLAGCSEESADNQKVSVVLDWYPNAVHSFLYVAQDRNYFADEKMDVEFRTPADTPDPLKFVSSGKADFAISYQNEVIKARAQGLEVVSVAAIVRKPLTQLMVSPDSEITRPRDLEGKRVGYSSIELYRTIVEAMVKADGGDPAKVRFVDIGWDLVPAMMSKRVDGIMGGFINHEQPILAKRGMNVNIIKGSDYGVHDYYELVLITNEETLKKNPDKVDRFVRAMRKGFSDTKKDPSGALNLVLSKANEKFELKPDIEKASLDMLLPLMDAGSEPFGTQSLESWEKASQWMQAQGAIEQPVNAKEAFVNRN